MDGQFKCKYDHFSWTKTAEECIVADSVDLSLFPVLSCLSLSSLKSYRSDSGGGVVCDLKAKGRTGLHFAGAVSVSLSLFTLQISNWKDY